MRCVSLATLALGVLLAGCKEDSTPLILNEPTGFVVPEGSVELIKPERGYVASLPEVMSKFAIDLEGADFAYGSVEDQTYMTLSSGLMGSDSPSEMFDASYAKLVEINVAVQFAELQEDRFVIFGIMADQSVVAQVTQFGEDCADQPMFGTVINGFDNDTTPIEYHFTNTHPLYPRFDFGALCQ